MDPEIPQDEVSRAWDRKEEPVAKVSSEYRRVAISSVDNRDRDGEVVAHPNSMDLKGGNNDLKEAFPNVEDTNLTSQTTECGVLRDEVGPFKRAAKEMVS